MNLPPRGTIVRCRFPLSYDPLPTEAHPCIVMRTFEPAGDKPARLEVALGTSKIAGEPAATSRLRYQLSPNRYLVIDPNRHGDRTNLRTVTVFHGEQAMVLPLIPRFFGFADAIPKILGHLDARELEAMRRVWRATLTERLAFQERTLESIQRAIRERTTPSPNRRPRQNDEPER